MSFNTYIAWALAGILGFDIVFNLFFVFYDLINKLRKTFLKVRDKVKSLLNRKAKT